MLFLSSRRAILSRGFFCAGLSVFSSLAHAQQLSPTPQIVRPEAFAPTLEENAPTLLPPEMGSALPTRLSAPRMVARALPRIGISPPPDDFYQTPETLDPWLLSLSDARPRDVKTRILGRTTGGRRIVALEIAPSGVSPWKLRRLVVLCRQHGNEPEASASGARFIREFLESKDPKKRRIAAKTALLIVPVANPDGAAYYRRRTDRNIDMNRDWGSQKSDEVRVLARWAAAWKPHLVVDVHQWLPDHTQPPPMAEASGGKLARQTAQRMALNNRQRGYWLAARSRWGLDTLCHRYFGQRFKIPSILLETRHRPHVAGAREVAIGTSLTALWSAAETVAK
jgi:murein tripeptide amidase MpaA